MGMEHAVIYAFKSPGSGAIYIGKHECNPDGWSRRGNGRLPDGYPGRGKVVEHFHRRHGAAVEWRILAVVPLTDWVRAERRAIHLARLIFGRKCVNILSGGEGLSSVAARALHADPAVKARHREALKAATATPERRAQMSTQAKGATATPEAKARMSAQAKARWSDPEAKARMSAQSKARWSDPETKARMSAGIREALAHPEVKARRSATNNTPEVKARRSVAAKEAQNRPEVRANQSATYAARREATAWHSPFHNNE